MLNGWNKKVRMTSAIRRAWMTTRIVSPKPLSDLVPEVTLIAFLLPHRLRGDRTFFLRESFFASRQENGLVLMLGAGPARGAVFALFAFLRLLDGCSQPRNQRPHQNFTRY